MPEKLNVEIISDLERDNIMLKNKLLELNNILNARETELFKYEENANNSFLNSTNRLQLENSLKTKELTIENLQRQLKLLEVSKSQKNERGAGRKAKYTTEEIEQMKEHKKNNLSYRAIANNFSCSVGTVYKLINE